MKIRGTKEKCCMVGCEAEPTEILSIGEPAISIYHLCKQHFDESVALLDAITPEPPITPQP